METKVGYLLDVRLLGKQVSKRSRCGLRRRSCEQVVQAQVGVVVLHLHPPTIPIRHPRHAQHRDTGEIRVCGRANTRTTTRGTVGGFGGYTPQPINQQFRHITLSLVHVAPPLHDMTHTHSRTGTCVAAAFFWALVSAVRRATANGATHDDGRRKASASERDSVENIIAVPSPVCVLACSRRCVARSTAGTSAANGALRLSPSSPNGCQI